MCAIAGILAEVLPQDAARLVSAMNKAQGHRGPDSDIVKEYPGAMLGHRRLSIIDLSKRSLGPMETLDGCFTLVYNGEIYNYKELRSQLEPDFKFRTNSDTEVLLAAWLRWGPQCLERLNGMFAFCVYDTRTRSAFFARDRFGQKPLFFAQRDGQLFFASEVKALLAAGIPASADMGVWSRYLVSASYDDASDSFFAGVSQLKPGECATWSPARGLSRHTYYHLGDRIPTEPINVTLEDAAQRVRGFLVDAARIHMRSDVPVGIALSGGLDSSSLLACLDLAGQLNKGVHCFSFDFGGDFTERQWIESAAGFHDLSADIHTFTPEEFRASIEPLIWHLEGPIGGLATCALTKVMEAAKTNGVVVVQDGTGLDEAFAGYRNHHNLYLGMMLERGEKTASQAVFEYGQNWGVDEPEARQSALNELFRSQGSHRTAIDGTMSTQNELLSSEFRGAYPGTALPMHTRHDLFRDTLVDYLQVRKIPRNTRMKDRLSMAYSIELRLPFLDHRLIEYALSLPPSFYFLYGRTKSIVREALKGAMDESVRIAHKRSIQAPQGLWLRQEPMRSYIGDLISSQAYRTRGIFDQGKVIRAFDQFCKTGADNSFFVWQWINVEEWFRAFVDQSWQTSRNQGFVQYVPFAG